jgi:N-methylhydantoinase A
VRSCITVGEVRAEFKAYMRYRGQGWEIPVMLTAEESQNPDPGVFKRLFEHEYSTVFGRVVDGMDIEITVWAVNATTVPQKAVPVKPLAATSEAASESSRYIFDAALGETIESKIVLRSALLPGQTVSGPAAITEDETTIILPASRRAISQPDGCIDIVRTDAGGTS